MYKVKFKDLILVSNKRKILSNYKTIFFFMVLVIQVKILLFYLKTYEKLSVDYF